MSEAGDDNSLDQLTDDERKQLHEFCEVTGAEDIALAINVLRARQWNLQTAIQAFYEPSSPTQQLPLAPTRSDMEYLNQGVGTGQVAESQLRRRGAWPQANGLESERSESQSSSEQQQQQQHSTVARHVVIAPAFSWMPLLAWPLVLPWRVSMSIVQSLLSLLGLRRIADDGTPSADISQRVTSSIRQPARSGVDDARDFLLGFEESFGVIHPPFFAGTYTRALEVARREVKHLLIVLWSSEHDDAEAMGQVLTHPDVVAYLSQPQFIVWAGNVVRSEAFQVASMLEAVSFPCVALAALKSQSRLGAAAGERYRLQVVARIDGLPQPSRAQSATAPNESDESDRLAQVLCRIISDSIAQHEAELWEARHEQEELEAERRLREQQNAAYEASLARDRERDAEARALEEVQRIERQKEEGRQREEQRAEELRKQWRWATLARLRLEEEQEAASADGADKHDLCKLNLRLESGSRIVRTFPAGAKLQRLFDFVETRDVAGEWEAHKKTPYGGDLSTVSPPEQYNHEYDFVLVSQFPRVVFADRQVGLKDMLLAKGMWPSATLIVEPLFEPDGSDSEVNNEE